MQLHSITRRRQCQEQNMELLILPGFHRLAVSGTRSEKLLLLFLPSPAARGSSGSSPVEHGKQFRWAVGHINHCGIVHTCWLHQWTDLSSQLALECISTRDQIQAPRSICRLRIFFFFIESDYDRWVCCQHVCVCVYVRACVLQRERERARGGGVSESKNCAEL